MLTKDENILANEIERDALVGANVACFMLGRGDLTAAVMGETFARALPVILRALRRFHVLIAASVNRNGGVRVLLADGNLQDPPRELEQDPIRCARRFSIDSRARHDLCALFFPFVPPHHPPHRPVTPRHGPARPL